MDATIDEGARLGRRASSEGTFRARRRRSAVEPATPSQDDPGLASQGRPRPDGDPVPGPGRPGGRRSGRPRRTDLVRLVGTPARRGRLLMGLLVLAVVVAGPLLARSGLSDARATARANLAERAGAAETRDAVEAEEERAKADDATAAVLAAEARAALDEQRRRLARLGLNEETIDAFLQEVTTRAESVEGQRNEARAEVDRQAVEIPQMQECMRVASQTVNQASNTLMFAPGSPVPAPSELCQALVAAGT